MKPGDLIFPMPGVHDYTEIGFVLEVLNDRRGDRYYMVLWSRSGVEKNYATELEASYEAW